MPILISRNFKWKISSCQIWVKGNHPCNAHNLDFSGKPHQTWCNYDSFQVTSASVIVPSPSVKPAVQSVKKADDDLEDWLDSVLGWLDLIYPLSTPTIVCDIWKSTMKYRKLKQMIWPIAHWSDQLLVFMKLSCVSGVVFSWAVQLLCNVHYNPRKGFSKPWMRPFQGIWLVGPLLFFEYLFKVFC